MSAREPVGGYLRGDVTLWPNVLSPGAATRQAGVRVISLLAVTLGAVIALTATLLAETIRARREHAALLSRLRYDSYLEFMLAFVRANDALRAIPIDDRNRGTNVAAAMGDSGLYLARERLLITGSPSMVLAGETVFRALLQIRDAVAQGTSVAWPDFHPATDGVAEAVWAVRQAARREFRADPLDLERMSALRVPSVTERLRRSE